MFQLGRFYNARMEHHRELLEDPMKLNANTARLLKSGRI